MTKIKPTPFEDAFAQHTAEQAEQLRKQQLVKFVRAIVDLRKRVSDESGIRDLGSQDLLRTGTNNS